MSVPVFIGDAISAAAYRLAGARTRVPEADQLVSALHEACAESELVLITAEYAQRLPQDVLNQAQSGLRPLVLVVPDVRERVLPPDLEKELRSQLGVEA